MRKYAVAQEARQEKNRKAKADASADKAGTADNGSDTDEEPPKKRMKVEGTAMKASGGRAMKAAKATTAAMKALGRTAMKAGTAKAKGRPIKAMQVAAVKADGGSTKGVPACPKVGDGPVDYKAGRIYTSATKLNFRVIRLRGQYSTERQIRWAKGKPSRAEWGAALKCIDEYKQ